MLVLSRKPGEKIILGNGVTITVVEVKGGRIRIGIDAPPSIHILRGELADDQGRDLFADAPRTPLHC